MRWCVAAILLLASSAAAAPKKRPPEPAPPAAAPGRGWSNPQALQLAKEGMEAKRSGDMQLCLKKDRESLALEEHPYVKLHIASCLAATGKIKDALVAARDALAAGIRNEDAELTQGASAMAKDLLPKIAKLKLQIPDKTEGLTITLNGQPLRPGQSDNKLSLDPGEYIVKAWREEKGERYSFEAQVRLGEGEEKEIEILPKQNNLHPETEECLRTATSYRERLKCIEEPTAKPNVHVGLEVSGYTDTTSVHVFTPSINAAVVSPTAGWNVGGSYLLDILTAASPDLVSTASGPFVERRHAASLGGGYKVGPVQLNANGNVSSEPDYLSRTIGLAGALDMYDKTVTPRLGYALQWDTIGYRNTPFDQFHRNLTVHAIDAGVTFVLAPTTLLVTGLSLGFESGENAKLYRFIPMFASDVAPGIQAGAPASQVDDLRLNIRARDNVPGSRNRVAIGGRINHRMGGVATLRVEQRFYGDSWGVKASTTDGRYLYDLTDRLRVWPHARLHMQTGAGFYQLAYVAQVDAEGNPTGIPQYRTTDREASPFAAFTIGGGARLGLTSDKASIQYAIVTTADLMYSRYFQSLFLTDRTALWGTIAFEADL